MAAEEWSRMMAALDRLPDDLRQVFELHYYMDLPQAAIAQQTGLHPREVSRRWMAARRQLQDWLGGASV